MLAEYSNLPPHLLKMSPTGWQFGQSHTELLWSLWVTLKWVMCILACTASSKLQEPKRKSSFSLVRAPPSWYENASLSLGMLPGFWCGTWTFGLQGRSKDATSWVTQPYFLCQWLNRSKGMWGISSFHLAQYGHWCWYSQSHAPYSHSSCWASGKPPEHFVSSFWGPWWCFFTISFLFKKK